MLIHCRSLFVRIIISQWNPILDSRDVIRGNAFENVVCKMTVISFSPRVSIPVSRVTAMSLMLNVFNPPREGLDSRRTWLMVNSFAASGPIDEHGLTLIPACISNYTHYKVWDGITYPFLNFNCVNVEVKQWICNSIPHFTVYVITYPQS